MQSDADDQKKPVQAATLTKLLQDLHQELKTCMDHRQYSGGMEGEQADPILLGDFIVDAYNSYLTAAKAAFDDPFVQGLPLIKKLGDLDTIPSSGWMENRQRKLAKMHEVAFATRQLLISLDNAEKSERVRAESEMSAAIALLENLGAQIDNIADMPVKMAAARVLRQEDIDDVGRLASPLIAEYNRCLTIVLEATDDIVMPRLFRPLDVGEGGEKSFLYQVAELKIAQSGLLQYLKKGWCDALKNQIFETIKGSMNKGGTRSFTDRVKRVMQMAREEAARLKHNYIGTEHLLLGVIKEGKGKAVQVMKNLGLNLEAVKKNVDEYVAASGGEKPAKDAPFTPRAKQILELASKEARELNARFVGTEHLLLALFKDQDGVAAQVLAAYGVNYEKAREEVVRTVGGEAARE